MNVTDGERHLMLSDREPDHRAGAAGTVNAVLSRHAERRELLEFGEGPGRDKDVRVIDQCIRPLDVAHGQAIRVSSYQSNTTPLCRNEHTGEQWSCIIR